MTTDFSSLNLRDEIMQAINELGYAEPTPIQSGMIPLMLTGADVIGQAQTGTGKTAAFALPILQNFKPQQYPQALVLAPTRELALQVADSMSEYGKKLRVRVLAVYGGQPYSPQINSLKRGVDIVVGTPGRLNDLLERGVLNLSEIKTVVLDEADEMLNMGFIEEVEKILATTPTERQTCLFSATMPTRIRKLADGFMRDPQSVIVKKSTLTLSTTEQRYYLVHENDKTNALTRLFEIEPIHSALIFARTRAETATLANELVVSHVDFFGQFLNPTFHFTAPILYNTDYLTFCHPPEGHTCTCARCKCRDDVSVSEGSLRSRIRLFGRKERSLRVT